jgi:hypothetical protein
MGFRQHKAKAPTWQECAVSLCCGMTSRIHVWLWEAIVISAILLFFLAPAK